MKKPAINYIRIVDEPRLIAVNEATGAVYVSNGKEIERINYDAPNIFTYGGKFSKMPEAEDVLVSSYNNNIYVAWPSSGNIGVVDENLNLFDTVYNLPDGIFKFVACYNKHDRKIIFQAFLEKKSVLIVIDSISGNYEKCIDIPIPLDSAGLTTLCCTPSGFVYYGNYGTQVFCTNIETEETNVVLDFVAIRSYTMDIATDNKRNILIIAFRDIVGMTQSINFYDMNNGYRIVNKIELEMDYETSAIFVNEINDNLIVIGFGEISIYDLSNYSLLGNISLPHGAYFPIAPYDDYFPCPAFDSKKNILYLLDGKIEGEDSHLIVLDYGVKLEINYPEAGSVIPRNARLAVRGTASAPETVIHVGITKNGKFWQKFEPVVKSTGCWDIRTQSLQKGDYVITATQMVDGVESHTETTFTCR